MLNRTSPVFVVLFAWWFLRETVPRGIAVLVGVALVGCGLLIGPDFSGARGAPLPGLVGALSAVLAALAYISIRELRRTDRPVDVVFFFSLFTVVACAPFLLEADARWPDAYEWLAAVGIGLCATLGQVAMTHSYRVERAGIVAPFIYASILVATLYGWLFWGEVPDRLSALGGALVVGSGVAITIRRARSVASEAGDRSDASSVEVGRPGESRAIP